MKIYALTAVIMLLSIQHPQQILTVSPEEITVADSTDILADVLAANSDSLWQHNNTFRPGNVGSYDFENYLTTTDFGYKIKLPATNNIPTPTWFENKIYVSGGFGSKEFFSFAAEDGALNWGISLDDDGPSSCVIEDGIVVFNTESCTIFAVDIKTGKQLWSWWMGDPLMSTPTIANGIVYSSYPCGANYSGYESNAANVNYDGISTNAISTNAISGNYSHAVIAFDLKSGNIIWQKRIEGDILSAPIEDNGTLHIVTFAGVYYTMNAKTGEFYSANRCRATSAPVISNGRSYYSQRGDIAGEAVSERLAGYNFELNIIDFSTPNKKAAYLDKDVQSKSKLKSESSSSDVGNGFVGGSPASANWQSANETIGQSNVSSLQNFYGSRIATNGKMQYNMMGDTLFCLDSESGKEYWKFDIAGDLHEEGGYLATAPILVGDYVITATLSGDVIVMKNTDGSVVNTYKINQPIRSQPIAMNGWIYVTTTTGYLFAINTGDITISGWPMLGVDNKHSNKIIL